MCLIRSILLLPGASNVSAGAFVTNLHQLTSYEATVYKYICVSMHVCMYVCMYVCVCLCVCVCVCVCV